jgi:hypothetical protein
MPLRLEETVTKSHVREKESNKYTNGHQEETGSISENDATFLNQYCKWKVTRI